MKKKPLYACIIAVFLLSGWAHLELHRLSGPLPTPENPQRIVSLAPSITETLYALGLGEQVAGVTRFCAYPPETRKKPSVAGFSDVDYEAVLRLRPDLIVLPQDKIFARARLEELGLPVMTFDTRTLDGFMEAVASLGESTGRQAEARAILDTLHGAVASAGERARGDSPPRVLFTIMHAYAEPGYIAEIHAIGRDGFYSQLITLAGGVNAYDGNLDFPRLSREAIIFLNPDVIIDVIPAGTNAETLEARRGWQGLDQVSAIKNGRLHLFTDAGDTVPGPRSCKTLERLSQVFYPPGA